MPEEGVEGNWKVVETLDQQQGGGGVVMVGRGVPQTVRSGTNRTCDPGPAQRDGA